MRSPIDDSNSRKRFHISSEFSGDKEPDERILKNQFITSIITTFFNLESLPIYIPFKQNSCVVVFIELSEKLDVGQKIIRLVLKPLQPQIKNLESDVLIFCAVVFHQCSSHKNVTWNTGVLRRKSNLSCAAFFKGNKIIYLTRSLEYCASWFDTFCSPGKPHVLNVTLLFNLQ